MDETLWDPVLKVHLDGTYQMTKAIWAQFVRQGHGSIINTTSTSGIYGNFGQANYSTAVISLIPNFYHTHFTNLKNRNLESWASRRLLLAQV